MVARSIAVMAIVLALIGVAKPPAVAAQAPAPCATAAAAALAQRGAPYIWGAKGPITFDCSGLVYWAWAQAGYDVGLSTYDQARSGVQIGCTLADIAGSATTCWQAGDLIFLRYTGGQHVAMYIGSGLFADAYNKYTGVIVHNPAADSFYHAHFWQSRRIVSCSGVAINPGNASSTFANPGLEDFPDLLARVSFSVPQCGTCNPNGSTILPATAWDGHWPEGTDALNLPLMFQTAISWLAWRISDLLRQLICWLLSMLAMLAAFLASLANVIVDGLNGLWKLGLLFWFGMQEWMTAIFYLLMDMMDLIGYVLGLLAMFLDILMPIISFVIFFLGQILLMLGLLVVQVIGFIGWVVGLVVGMFAAVLIALGGTTVPTQLIATYTIYRLLRGALEGFRDSAFGWILYLMWALCYVWSVFWVSRFFSGERGGSEE